MRKLTPLQQAIKHYGQLTLLSSLLSDQEFLELEVTLNATYLAHEHTYLVGCLRHYRRMAREAE